jgi:hypothetical protein
MTMRWMYPPELERQGARDRFDPVREGDRHRLSREMSIAIWERVCAETTDGSGQRDVEQAKRRFHEIAALVAARGGRLLPDVGRYTRVGVELGGMPLAAWGRDLLARPAPGRETRVTRAEAERAAEVSHQRVSEAREEAATSHDARRDHLGDERLETPRAGEVAPLLASLLQPTASPRVLDLSEQLAARRQPGADPALWSPPDGDPGPRNGRLPAATRARMEQAYGERFDDVEIHVDSPEVPIGLQAFTRGRHIHFGRGAFEPDSEHGEHVIAHELAHVAQQSQPAGDGRRPAPRAALEADAHQAALAALAGRAATVNLFAPSSAALAFSNGKAPRPASAPGAGGRAPAQTARGAGPAPSGGATPGAGGGSHGGGSPAGAPHAPGGGPAAAGGRPGAAPGGRPAGTAPGGEGAPATAAAPRRAAGGDLLMPEAPNALTPAAAGRLQAVRSDNQGVAAATTDLPTAQQQTDVARAAVVEPQAEQDAHAQHGVVAAVDDRPPPSPEIEQACTRIRQVIRDKRPPSEDKLVEAKPKEMAQAAGNEMSAGVDQRAGSVRQGYSDMQQQPKGTPDTTPVPATLPPDRASTPPVNAAAAAPDPLKHDDVALDGDVAAQQQKVQDAGMNTEPGQLVKDGPIGDARGGVGDLQTMAKTDPQKVLADQAAAIAHAQGDMRALQAAAEKALADARAGAVGHMATHTTTVKGSEEQQRAAAGAQMQAVFTRTQQTVDGLLQPLSGNAVARWEAGVAQLSTEFENSLAKVKQKITERHSGVLGGLTELGDDVFGLPGWVTEDYDIAEARFGDGATKLITDISRDVNQVIEDCKKLIDQARKDIEAVVKSLPASLQSWAQGEANRLGQQLDQLSQKVDQTQKGLNQDLINRANGAVQQVREQVADLREQAKGLLGKIADAIAEFIKNPAKAIVDGLLRILGIPPPSFWALVDKLGDVISGIAADPKKFANTLMAGVGQGFQQFFHNLPVHLGQALFQWLFSKLGEAGVQMPADFSIKSILTLVLEIMGITWARIKMILAKHIGPQGAEILDQAIKLITVLMEKGPQGVFEMIKEQLDPSMIIDAIKDAAIQYVMQTIVTRVAARILMMLNPAGAILQAIEAIYRVIKWVIDNAARIFTLIESIVNGAQQILAGNTAGVANLVESSLVRLLVPVIDFLADYLGLGGIPDAIKKVILGLQKRVEAILDKVIGFLVEKAKALWQAIKTKVKGKDDKDKDDSKDPEKAKENQQKLETARAAIRAALHTPTPVAKARTTIQQIATEHGVTVTFDGEKHGLRYTLKINPSLSDYLEGEQMAEADEVLKRLKVTNKSATEALRDAVEELRQQSQAKTTMKQDATAAIKAAGGFEALLLGRPDIVKSKAIDNQGVARENAIKAAQSATAAGDDSLVHLQGPAGPGIDSLMINTKTREVTAVEVKGEGVPVLHGRQSDRPVPPGSTAHDPMPGTQGSTLGQQHLGIGPSGAIADPTATAARADQIVAGTPVATPTGRVMENKLSAVTQNLMPNLTTRADSLAADIATARAKLGDLDPEARQKAEAALSKQDAALQVLRDVISGAQGTLHIVLAEPVRPDPTKPDAQDAAARHIAEAMQVLEAGRRNFLASQEAANVAVDLAIVQMDEKANIVKTTATG